MKLDKYQEQALTTCNISPDNRFIYTTLGLTGEAGEVSDKVKRTIRGDKDANSLIFQEELAKELGDVLWYLAVLADTIGYTLSDVAYLNLHKLQQRKKAGTISGTGDNREKNKEKNKEKN